MLRVYWSPIFTLVSFELRIEAQRIKFELKPHFASDDFPILLSDYQTQFLRATKHSIDYDETTDYYNHKTRNRTAFIFTTDWV